MQISKQKSTDKNHKYDTKALPEQTTATTNYQDSEQSEQIKIEELSQALVSQLSQHDNQIDRLKIWKQITERLENFPLHSKILTAIIEPGSLSFKYASHPFYELMGIERGAIETQQNIKLNELFSDWDNTELKKLYRLQILHWVLKQLYEIDTANLQFQDSSVISTVNSLKNSEPKYIEFWFCSQELKVTRVDQKIDEFIDFNFQSMSKSEEIAWLIQPGNVEILAQKLKLENYQIEGLLLLEGLDVTLKEQKRKLIQLLVEPESLMQQDKFKAIDKLLRSLFRADDMILLRNEGEKQYKLFIGSEFLTRAKYPKLYSTQSLQDSPILKSAKTNQIENITELESNCRTECEQNLFQKGVRSLLLIPLVIKPASPKEGSGMPEILGIAGLMSNRPSNFNVSDYQNAQDLIPAFSTAVRQTIQERFTNIRNIHPAVEWRFLQEAERRRWGLPAETIVFENVYPLYGICDIRGSSTERNRAIQSDILAQFRLGLAIVETVCQKQDSALCEQLRQDLLEHIKSLEKRVSVNTEITALEYLRCRLEIYFDYFEKCGDTIKVAVEAYRAACDNIHHGVYQARERYDQMLYKINYHLQNTWENWQTQMQLILPHHCDLEATDGIDHMMYVGKSINSKFNQFHLSSLRYDQLRAICDCARTALRLKAESEEPILGVVHLILVQNGTIDIYHNESTERLFDVKGTHDIRYEIVKKRIDKGVDKETKERITQPGMLTVVYSTDEEWEEYEQYFRYLVREGWVEDKFETGLIEPLQGISGLRFLRAKVLLPKEPESTQE
ncbi:MAG: GAF domain-containing protein [Okeania sp. SIO3I5]|uniref:GAF domain-containing protein n=1 Tax=Okeania sp. SIO3I5 TaxID=2607805 RepID=UPI0013BAB2B8|nr:GAF domain-containing protein [Okeania sp. SIO3I5]NEQ37580.1 GAF domain-containing protein [Okeania sp. SIO3I5]